MGAGSSTVVFRLPAHCIGGAGKQTSEPCARTLKCSIRRPVPGSESPRSPQRARLVIFLFRCVREGHNSGRGWVLRCPTCIWTLQWRTTKSPRHKYPRTMHCSQKKLLCAGTVQPACQRSSPSVIPLSNHLLPRCFVSHPLRLLLLSLTDVAARHGRRSCGCWCCPRYFICTSPQS